MKKVLVEINASDLGSTGNVLYGVSNIAKKMGYNVYSFSPKKITHSKAPEFHTYFGSIYERRISILLNKFIGGLGRFNVFSTKRLINMLKEIKPDIVHLHILHSNYINIQLLFKYLKKSKIQVVWTFHDCWAFTGGCPHFIISGCKKWKDGCYNCNYKSYPAYKRDWSKKLYCQKKKFFLMLSNMTIVTPSNWLKDLVKESFFKNISVCVIPNGINTRIFKSEESSLRKEYGITNKFIILGVAESWGFSKGLDRFEALSEQLDNRFCIVLVGIDSIELKNRGIICIKKTVNQQELAKWYSVADVLLNPTREDNFPTVNIEALSCGTPVLSYGAGGSAEAFDELSGSIVNDENIVEKLEELYVSNYKKEDCENRGRRYESDIQFEKYVKLFDNILTVEKR